MQGRRHRSMTEAGRRGAPLHATRRKRQGDKTAGGRKLWENQTGGGTGQGSKAEGTLGGG